MLGWPNTLTPGTLAEVPILTTRNILAEGLFQTPHRGALGFLNFQ